MIRSTASIFAVLFGIFGVYPNQPSSLPPSQQAAGGYESALIPSIRDTLLPHRKKEGFVFKYGPDWKNVYDGFAGRYTLLGDTGKSTSVNIRLSAREVDSIFGIMKRIDFFDLPDAFSYQGGGGHLMYVAGTGQPIYFGVCYREGKALRQKEFWWIDHSESGDSVDERAVNVRYLVLTLRSMLEHKPAIISMPHPYRMRRID